MSNQEEGQDIKHGAYLWLRQQTFSGGGIFPHPTPGLVSLNFQCIWEVYVVGWSQDGGAGVPQPYAEGVLTDIIWGKEVVCTEPGCAAFIHVPASSQWSIHNVLSK